MEQFIQSALEIAVFGGKVMLVVVGLVAVIAVAASVAQRNKSRELLEIENLNHRFDNFARALKSRLLDKKAFQAEHKAKKKASKKRAKDGADREKPRVFVLDFVGDIKASAVETLRDEITAILSVAGPSDEVVVRLESPGGAVHAYGLAAAQLARIKEHHLKLTVCVDKVAASGGYMMACTAHTILAAPFAIVGSIGVVAQVPNFHRLLKKNDIDYEEFTAGEFKRTVSLLGEISEKGRQKFNDQLEDTHRLFKDFIHQQRPQVDLERVATGEYWLAIQAKDLHLVDRIQTSDEYLFLRREDAQIFHLKLQARRKWGEKLSDMVGEGVARGLERLLWSQDPRWRV